MARRRSSGITSLSFNQDQDCFTCCLTSGLRVYNVEPLVEKTHYSKEELGEVSLCEMIFRTNWLLLVRARRPCSLFLLDDQQRAFKAEVHFKSPIRSLRARRDKVAVVLSSSIQVLSIPTLTRVALLRTPSNARPLCAIATDPNATPILIAPAHRRGSLQILDVSRSVKGAQSSSPAVINCHHNYLVCLSVSPNGMKLATASARGTLIRIWDAASKHLLHELRRGSDYADVYCINFNPSGSLVCCVSDKGTLHVWAARGAYAHLASAHAHPDTRALCAFAGDTTAIGITAPGFTALAIKQISDSLSRNNSTIVPNSITATGTRPLAIMPSSVIDTTKDVEIAEPHNYSSRRPRSVCGFIDDNNSFVVCEDGTFHKFKFSSEGTCHRSDFDYFLQVGDDDEFMQ